MKKYIKILLLLVVIVVSAYVYIHYRAYSKLPIHTGEYFRSWQFVDKCQNKPDYIAKTIFSWIGTSSVAMINPELTGNDCNSNTTYQFKIIKVDGKLIDVQVSNCMMSTTTGASYENINSETITMKDHETSIIKGLKITPQEIILERKTTEPPNIPPHVFFDVCII